MSETEQLTTEELQLLIQVISQISVPIAQAPIYIRLMNKMGRIVKQLKGDDSG